MSDEPLPNIDGYRLIARLGEGAMAQVYLAIQEGFERKVALKVLTPQLAREERFEQRFTEEARLASQLSHPNIVPIYDFGHSHSHRYIAMEYLPGGDLKQRMLEGIPLVDAIALVSVLAKAIDHAGQQGLIHRDIKPENILFRENRTPVICDFGIARELAQGSQLTMVGNIIGTPRYMSPEQAQGLSVDIRSDLYSLSVILYELLCGHAPFLNESALTVSLKHISELPPPLPPQLSVFQGIIDKALAKQPGERFQSGADLAAALAQAEEQISASFARTVIVNTSELMCAVPVAAGRAASRALATTATASLPRPAITATLQDAADTPRSVTPFYRKPMILAGALLALNAGAIGLWYFAASPHEKTLEALSNQAAANPIPGMAEKAESLLRQAREAYHNGHLFEPEHANAQLFLTTLLALVPHHATGREEISILFERYLDTAKEHLSNQDIEDAEQFLNQASQISYYIENAELKDRFSALYKSLLKQRQQSLVAEEHTRYIEELLANARESLAQDRLTAPPGDNAFEHFQQILRSSPQHAEALSGIRETASRLLQKALVKSEEGLFAVAQAFVAAATQIAPTHPEIATTQEKIAQSQQAAQELQLRQNTQRDDDFLAKKARIEQERLNQHQQIHAWLSTAEDYVEADQLVSPEEENALELYERVLALEPNNVAALQGRELIGALLVDRALRLAQEDEFQAARNTLETASRLLTIKTRIFTTEQHINQMQRAHEHQQLLERAQQAMAANQLEYPVNESAVFFYKKILEHDPSNIEARQGMDAVGLKYLELSREALSRDDFSEARRLYTKAQRYTSSDIELQMAEAFFKEQASEPRIKELLASAESALQRGRLTRPAKQNALHYYRQILALIPGHSEALAGVEKVRSRYEGIVRRALAAEDATRARDSFEVLQSIAANAAGYPDLVQEISALEAKAKAQAKVSPQRVNPEQIKRYRTEITEILQSPVKHETNRALIDRYLAILALQPDDKAAQDGLLNTLRDEEKRAEEALNRMDVALAEHHMAVIHTAYPEYDLSNLTALKARVELKRAEIEDNVAKIETNLARPYSKPGWLQSHRSQRDLLIATYNYIDDLRVIHPEDPRVAEYLRQLDQKYADIIGRLVQEQSEEAAKKFLSDTLTFQWPGTQVAQLRESLDRRDGLKFAPSETTDMEALLEEAARLIDYRYNRPGLFESNREARDRLIKAYHNIAEVRATRPEEPRVNAYLVRLDQKYADIVQQLLTDNNTSEAEKFIRDTRHFKWRGTQLTLVAASMTVAADKAKLAEVDEHSAIDWLLQEAELLIARPYNSPGLLESHRLPRERLSKAYQNLNQVRQLNPQHESLETLFQQLDSKYAEIVRTLLQAQDEDAYDFINDTRHYDWISPQLNSVIKNHGHKLRTSF